MFNKHIRSFLLYFTIGLLFFSCLPPKKYNFYQRQNKYESHVDTTIQIVRPIHRIKPNDILSIYVTSLSSEASDYFNPNINKSEIASNDIYRALTGYLVDKDGIIQLPIIGNVKVEGLTIANARDTIRMRLEKYLITPSVLVHLENYKITMLGEVSRSGVYPINNEKISISEAIALAGDITPYGMRTNVLIVRETENGNPEYGYIDLTSNDVFKSPYYYLQPNDIVYVNARRTRVATGDFFYRVVPVVVSFATLISILYLRFSKYL